MVIFFPRCQTLRDTSLTLIAKFPFPSINALQADPCLHFTQIISAVLRTRLGTIVSEHARRTSFISTYFAIRFMFDFLSLKFRSLSLVKFDINWHEVTLDNCFLNKKKVVVFELKTAYLICSKNSNSY